MQTRQNLFFAVVLLLCVVNFSKCLKHEHVWPHPAAIKMTEQYFLIDPNQFQVKLPNDTSNCDLLQAAIARYNPARFFPQDCSRLDAQMRGQYFHDSENAKLRDDKANYLGALKSLTINFSGKCEHLPHLNMSENYRITVNAATGATLSAPSIWGILRAIETFSQLLHNVGKNQFMLNAVQIDDRPRFSHRGLLIDTARHFLPLHSLRETLDAMEMNKLNVFHWHIVDDQSFPFVSDTFPQLSEKGAFDARTHVYRKPDVEAIIEYARMRGIRVLIEFDSPGHTRSWRKGIPQVVTQCYDSKHRPVEENWGVLDPTNKETYRVVQKLFTEIVGKFPDQYLHLGGDEVNFHCWASNPKITEFMKKMSFGTNYRRLESYYIQRLVKFIETLHKSYIVWQEVFDDNVTLKADTVVHVWKRKDWQVEMKKVTGAGFRTLLSAPWYLNVISYGTDWGKFYEIEPLNFDPTPEQAALLMGGEACMWGEWVDASNLISRTWPRASTVAERLWSPAAHKSAAAAKARFHEQHCRMQTLGLRVQPIDGPGYYCPCDYAM